MGNGLKIGTKLKFNDGHIFTLVDFTKRGRLVIVNEQGKRYTAKSTSNYTIVKDDSTKEDDKQESEEKSIDKNKRNLEIQSQYKAGKTVSQLAKEFNLSYVRVYSIVK